ncbi:MAG: hypothetical protein CMD68_05025 [Gammaproteobacteria bacterium]|nr:hypothetical protein [Gammaproteobacteria bacterium]|tara:strand:- start:202 stop:600 length:399 start_codon:yes stop_codon:yes gene_type:complete
MHNKNKILVLLSLLYAPFSISKETNIFNNISINADKVLFKQQDNQIKFLNNIVINIDDLTIKGNDALMEINDKKLSIYGNPALLSSQNLKGHAASFIIYPNKSMEMVGNARLINNDNLIESNFITYQIAPNE